MWKNIQKSLDSQESFVSMALGLAVVLAVGVLAFNYLSKGRGAATESQKTGEQKENVKLPTEHSVTEGETLWSISETYYKSGYNWVDIQTTNNINQPDKIEVGQKLVIPDVTPIPAPQQGQITSAASTEAGKTEQKNYTVVGGDSLWNIAVKEYGNGYEWEKIAQLNKLANPDLIHAGNVLILP